MAILKVEGVQKKFKQKSVLQNVNFSCQTGEIIGIFGRNGSGKSTLLKILFGVLQSDQLDLFIDNRPITIKEIIPSGLIAYLPQESFLPKEMKVRSAIATYFDDGDKQDAIFYAPKIPSIDNRRIGDLSIGELRYLEVLLIGFSDHPFILLDEPFSMIEPLHKDLIKDFLILQKEKKGIIITDHYYDDVLQITTKNFLLKDGVFYPAEDRQALAKYGYLGARE